MTRPQDGDARTGGPGTVRSPRGKKRTRIDGTVVGLLVALDEKGVPRIDYSGTPQGCLPARTTVSLSAEQIGQEVVLVFEEGDPWRPIIMGVLQNAQAPESPTGPLQAKIDGETITFAAEKEIVLRCGEASIILTREGKIQLRGTYLLSRSSGVNRLQGGSIELN